MTIQPLSINEASVRGATHKVVFTYADLAGIAATTGSIQVLPDTGTLPIGAILKLVDLDIITGLTGGTGLSTNTMIVGDSDDDNRYLTAYSTATAGRATASNLTGQAFRYTAARAVNVTFASSTSNLSTATAGEVHLYFRLQLPQV